MQWHEFWRVDAIGSGPGGVGAGSVSFHAESALCEFWNGSDDVGNPAGTGLYQAQIYCEIRGMLPRALRFAAGEGGVGSGNVGNSGGGGRPGGGHTIPPAL